MLKGADKKPSGTAGILRPRIPCPPRAPANRAFFLRGRFRSAKNIAVHKAAAEFRLRRSVFYLRSMLKKNVAPPCGLLYNRSSCLVKSERIRHSAIPAASHLCGCLQPIRFRPVRAVNVRQAHFLQGHILLRHSRRNGIRAMSPPAGCRSLGDV